MEYLSHKVYVYFNYVRLLKPIVGSGETTLLLTREILIAEKP